MPVGRVRGVVQRADVVLPSPRRPPPTGLLHRLCVCAIVCAGLGGMFVRDSSGIMVPHMGVRRSAVIGPTNSMEWTRSGDQLLTFGCGEGGHAVHSARPTVRIYAENERCTSTDTKEHTSGYSSHYHDTQSHSTPTHKQESTVRRPGLCPAEAPTSPYGSIHLAPHTNSTDPP